MQGQFDGKGFERLPLSIASIHACALAIATAKTKTTVVTNCYSLFTKLLQTRLAALLYDSATIILKDARSAGVRLGATRFLP